MKIIVLCGGCSTERDVSLSSSEKIAGALKSRGHQVILLDVFWGSETRPDFKNEQDIAAAAAQYRELTPLTTDELKRSRSFFGPYVLEACKEADIVFLGLHGADGEDGKVQAAFDLFRIRYTGSGQLSSAIAMSKSATKSLLSGKIRMPSGIVLHAGDPFRERLSAPCVIKPDNGGSSVGVTLVFDDSEYESVVRSTFRYCDIILAEEMIKGRELTQGVLNGQALPPVEICPDEGFYDYTNKYSGKTKEICPAEIEKEVLELMSEYSLLAGRILGLTVYYRMDYILADDGTLYCLEANSLPGMTDTSLVPQEAMTIGMDYAQLCENIIKYSLQKYN